jgi:ectoine hydrolase
MLSFELPEFKSRLAAVKRIMESKGVDAMFVIDEPNISWVTGYQGTSAYVPQGMLVTIADDEPTLIMREMDIPCATASTWVNEKNMLCYDERILGLGNPVIWASIGRIIRSRTQSKRFALERGAAGLSFDNYNALLGELGLDKPVDADGWVNSARAVKSPAELKYMTEAGLIVDHAVSCGISEIRVGARECDIGATILQKLAAGLPNAPGGSPHSSVTMPVGPISNAPHLKWSDAVYKKDSQTNFEVGAFRHRYCTALSRTVVLGTPTARQRHIDETVRGAFEATLPAIKTGARCMDAYAAFWKAFSPHGVRKESRIGYGIGIDWTEGSYSLQRDDERVLLKDSTVHLIIGIWEQKEGYVFSETLRVTDQGAATFSRVPRKMFVND